MTRLFLCTAILAGAAACGASAENPRGESKSAAPAEDTVATSVRASNGDVATTLASAHTREVLVSMDWSSEKGIAHFTDGSGRRGSVEAPGHLSLEQAERLVRSVHDTPPRPEAVSCGEGTYCDNATIGCTSYWICCQVLDDCSTFTTYNDPKNVCAYAD